MKSFPIRLPAVAGTFYPKEHDKLRTIVNDSMASTIFNTQFQRKNIIAAIVPHAGYIYSGKTAAYVYETLKNQSQIDTVIILGPCHRQHVNIALWPDGSWKTPLGNVMIDEEISKEIISALHNHVDFNIASINDIIDCHKNEHSIEVQLPFLQIALPTTKIIPILIGNYQRNIILSEIIANTIINSHKNIVILVSTDLSHYHNLIQAQNLDSNTIQMIEKQEIDNLIAALQSHNSEMCGYDAVLTLLNILQILQHDYGAINSYTLNYATSYNTTQDEKSVVGYVSMIFTQNN